MVKESKSFLLGKIWPHYQEEMKIVMESWRDMMCEELKCLPVAEWEHLTFDFKNHKKCRIYRDLMYAFRKKWTRFRSVKEMARFLASGSNIAENEDFHIRVETIRHSLNQQLKYIT
jgi:hypothetical protein